MRTCTTRNVQCSLVGLHGAQHADWDLGAARVCAALGCAHVELNPKEVGLRRDDLVERREEADRDEQRREGVRLEALLARVRGREHGRGLGPAQLRLEPRAQCRLRLVRGAVGALLPLGEQPPLDLHAQGRLAARLLAERAVHVLVELLLRRPRRLLRRGGALLGMLRGRARRIGLGGRARRVRLGQRLLRELLEQAVDARAALGILDEEGHRRRALKGVVGAPAEARAREHARDAGRREVEEARRHLWQSRTGRGWRARRAERTGSAACTVRGAAAATFCVK